MKTYKVIYTIDKTITRTEMIVDAKDYTDAYLSACYKLPKEVIVLEIIEIE